MSEGKRLIGKWRIKKGTRGREEIDTWNREQDILSEGNIGREL